MVFNDLTERERLIRDAIHHLVNSLRGQTSVYADMAPLTEATSSLPLSGMKDWEYWIRAEFDNALSRYQISETRFMTWLDLISWNGYRREKTLRTLSGGAANAFFFSFVLHRLNDWVEAVRGAACEALPRLAAETDSEIVAEAASVMLCHWNSWGRIGERERKVLLDIISQPRFAEPLRQMLLSSPSGPMPTLFGQLGRSGILDQRLVEIARTAAQPTVRARAFRSLFEGRMYWLEGRELRWKDKRYCIGEVVAITGERPVSVDLCFSEMMALAATDPSVKVRRIAAEFLIKHCQEPGFAAAAYARQFAADTDGPVAERGEFALRKLAEISE